MFQAMNLKVSKSFACSPKGLQAIHPVVNLFTSVSFLWSPKGLQATLPHPICGTRKSVKKTYLVLPQPLVIKTWFTTWSGDRCALFLLKNIFLPDEGLVEMEEMGRGARDRGILFPKNGRLKKKCPIFAAGNRFNANYDGFSNILFW